MFALSDHMRKLRSACLASAMLLSCPALAEDCGLCDEAVVTNAELAQCFLAEYEKLAAGDGVVVVVDLSQCETSRGLAEALPSPLQPEGAAEPDFQFMLSRTQLACLKLKLEQPGLVLDPSVRIELASCG
jgi:hypothetical protein